MLKVLRAALVAALLPAAASAQTVTLQPENPARWDVAVNVGWLGANKADIAPEWNGWTDAAAVDASVGYHFTKHLKIELGVGTSGEASITIVEPLAEPVGSWPPYQTREHRFRSSTVTGGVTYQFLENAWFHPFVGAGVAVIHERERARAQLGQFFFRDAFTRIQLPSLPEIDRTVTTAHPYGALGFKAYASERVFFRTDLRVSASTEFARSVEWRAGMGIDF